jgi:hypothetical protein
VSSEAKGPWEEHRFEDIEFHVRVSLKEGCWMDYEIFDLVLFDDGEGPPLKFIVEHPEGGPDTETTDIEKATRFMHGCVKWDGCSHNNFDSAYIHGCERKEMTRIGILFDKLFDLACERMPQHAEECLR